MRVAGALRGPRRNDFADRVTLVLYNETDPEASWTWCAPSRAESRPAPAVVTALQDQSRGEVGVLHRQEVRPVGEIPVASPTEGAG